MEESKYIFIFGKPVFKTTHMDCMVVKIFKSSKTCDIIETFS